MSEHRSRSKLDKSLAPPANWLNAPVEDITELGPLFLVMTTLLAAGVRLFGLTDQSLWVDEIMTWAMIKPGAGLDFFEQITDAIQGPLYLALTWPLVRLADTPFMLRILPAVAGILVIPFYGLTIQKFFGGRAARLAVLLLVLNPFHIWYSQEGRGYAFLVLFSVLMAWFLLQMMRGRLTLRNSLLFALCSAAAVWSNMSGLFLWAAMGLSVLIWATPRSSQAWGLWGLAFGGGLLAVTPWILKAAGIWAVDRMVVGASTGEALRGASTFSLEALPYTVFSFFYGYSLGPSLRELHQIDPLAVLKPALPLLGLSALPVAAGLLSGVGRLRRQSLPLLVWILVPVVILIFLAVRNVKPWNPRYVMVVLPWAIAVCSYGLMRLPRWAGASMTLILVVLTLVSLGNYHGDGRYDKADIQAMTTFVEAREQESPAAISPLLIPVVTGVFHYYYQGSAEVINTFERAPLTSSTEADLFCREILADKDDLLWLEARSWFFDPRGHLAGALSRQGHLRLIHETDGTKLYHWQSPEKAKADHAP